PAKRVVKFKVGRVMRERVCDEVDPSTPSANGNGTHDDGAANDAAPTRPQPPSPPPARPGSPF
ncbi:MAG: hypothetical protein AAGA20_22520, partial [Planctomycetota bacterium]